MKKRWKWFKENITPCIVTFSILTCLLFTVFNMIFATKGVTISDTLVEWVFKFFGLELLALSGIKVSKHIGSAFGKLESKIDGTEGDEDGSDTVG